MNAVNQTHGSDSLPVAAPPAPSPDQAGVLVLRIEQMDCPTEESLLRKKLEAMEGVDGLGFNLLQRRLTVHHHLADTAPIIAAVAALGMAPLEEPAPGRPAEQASPRAARPGDALGDPQGAAAPAPNGRQHWGRLACGASAAALAEIIAAATGTDHSPAVIALALGAIATSGTGTFKKGWIALRNFNLNINVLMVIAVTGAVVIGQWPEAAMVMVLFTLAEMIEARSLERARLAIRGLMEITPELASVLQADGTWRDAETATLAVGTTARIGPGERIGLDGQLTKGQSSVDQAPITGESMPVAKTVGDKVFAGTINQSGSFEYRVTAPQTDSTLARIIRAVEDAQGSRAPTQRFVDRFASIYTPAVFLLALGIALVPPLLLGLPWMLWLYKALVLLIIACPCALVVSTPVTVVSGLAAAARAGILIKGGAYLEEGSKLKSLALDKTGTITQGKPVVTDVVALGGDAGLALRLAASLAARSDHPVSSAIKGHWQARPGAPGLDEVDDFEALAGRGVKGRIGRQWFYLGNHRLVEELGLCNAATEAALNQLEADGKTAVVICSDAAPLAVIGVADAVRASSKEAVEQLHALGIRTLMLTGDNALTALAIARNVGIDDARGNLLPEDKLAAINSELASAGAVGMVGDGINDAPALARASIGFAMGAAGSDTALETADVALMDDDLRKIPQFVRLSVKVGRILKQNIAIALGIKAVFLVLACMGLATLWMAVFADMGASLIVVFNGLRLLQRRNNGAV